MKLIRPEITLGNIIQIVVLLAGFTAYVVRDEHRKTRIEDAIASLSEHFNSLDTRVNTIERSGYSFLPSPKDRSMR